MMSAGHHVTWPGVLLRAVTGCLGAGMILLPVPDLPERAWLLIPVGLLLVAASLGGPLARWRAVGTLAAVAAVAESALGLPSLAVLAVPVPVSAWLLVAGAGAAVAATVIALPRRPGQPRQPR